MPATVIDNTALMRNGRLFAPLNIAAYITWAAIAFDTVNSGKAGHSRVFFENEQFIIGILCVFTFITLFIVAAMHRGQHDRHLDLNGVLAIAQGGCSVAANALLNEGNTVILSIIVATQCSVTFRPIIALLWMMLFNIGFAAKWYSLGNELQLLVQMLPIFGFQAFAALTAHYAVSAERSRDTLLKLNAELLATRALLDESARGEERLRLSRELHDVAGHSLTALKLNLGAALRDPQLAAREDLRISSQLADELLAQIRQVVSALRMHDGLDLRVALEALVQTLPAARIELQIEDQLRVDDLDQAETLLRCTQEAITNALRHGGATNIRISLQRRAGSIELHVENDGRRPNTIIVGHGLTGMRERLNALGGNLEIDVASARGFHILARIPERGA